MPTVWAGRREQRARAREPAVLEARAHEHGQHDVDVVVRCEVRLLDRARVDAPALDELPHERRGVRLLAALREPEQDAEERPDEQWDSGRRAGRLVLEEHER